MENEPGMVLVLLWCIIYTLYVDTVRIYIYMCVYALVVQYLHVQV